MKLAILNCSQLVTVAGAPIADGAMLVRDGRITTAGKRADIGSRITHPGFGGNRVEENELRAAVATYAEME